MKKAGKAFVFIAGTVSVWMLCCGVLDHFSNHTYYDPKDYVKRAVDIAALVLTLTWSAVAMWQLSKRVPFRFIAWGVAALFSGIVIWLSAT